MIVSHPSNLARLVDFYGGHMADERDPATGDVVRPGVIERMPDMEEMRRDLFSVSVDNPQHYRTMKEVFEKYRIILDPHGAVGWRALELYRSGGDRTEAVVYETADPGKFPYDVEQAIGIVPALPPGVKRQARLAERIYTLTEEPHTTAGGRTASPGQIKEAKEKIALIFSAEAK
jgi:threonine synthase